MNARCLLNEFEMYSVCAEAQSTATHFVCSRECMRMGPDHTPTFIYTITTSVSTPGKTATLEAVSDPIDTKSASEEDAARRTLDLIRGFFSDKGPTLVAIAVKLAAAASELARVETAATAGLDLACSNLAAAVATAASAASNDLCLTGGKLSVLVAKINNVCP